ncbi:MAG: ribonuclease H-like domain-containing protein [Chloroflexi bacterium]|nr:ribonuclease H-like domain-containing protein [Chloroflexota bacterium]
MRNIIVFDLETQHTADEVGGWRHIRDMGLAVAVTYNAAEDVYRDYTEQEVGHLIATLRGADLVVGYNVLRFDYEVLHAYTTERLERIPTLDMLDDLYHTLGWRLKLDNVAAATLGETKSADGIQAVRWFRQGQLDKVIEYCRRDVEVTWKVYQFGRRNGYVKYRDRRWRVHRVPVKW